jgi:hypothetical protein
MEIVIDSISAVIQWQVSSICFDHPPLNRLAHMAIKKMLIHDSNASATKTVN